METTDFHPDDGRPRRRTRVKCRAYCRLFLAHLFSHVGLCTLVCGYAVIGAFAFEALESANEKEERKMIQKRRQAYAQKMWDMTLELNVLYEANWTANVLKQLRNFETSVLKQKYDAKPMSMYADGDTDADKENQWSFSGALLYSVTVITTIGYGNIAPRTSLGKVVTIVYALFGIPLMLLCLSNIGDLLAHGFKFTYSRLCCVLCREDDVGSSRQNRQNSTRPGLRSFHDGSVKYVTGTTATMLAIASQPTKQFGGVGLTLDVPTAVVDPAEITDSKIGPSPLKDKKPSPIPSESEPTEPMLRLIGESLSTTGAAIIGGTGSSSQSSSSSSGRVPITMVLAFVSGYICLGAAIFSAWEKWSFLNGAYFCFITLSTIGFGDLVPGTSILDTRSDTGQAKLIICCVYLILGLAIIAMSFSLVQEEVTAKCKQIGRNLGILDNDK